MNLNDGLMIALAVLLFGTLPALFLYIFLHGLVDDWRQAKANLDSSTVSERLRKALKKMTVAKIGKFSTAGWSGFQRTVVLMFVLFALIVAGYYLMSPYQRCMRVLEGEMSPHEGKGIYELPPEHRTLT